MTLERPMFPPIADECRVIQFSDFAAAAKLAKEERPDALTSYRDERLAKRAARLLEVTTAPETLTERSGAIEMHRQCRRGDVPFAAPLDARRLAPGDGRAVNGECPGHRVHRVTSWQDTSV